MKKNIIIMILLSFLLVSILISCTTEDKEDENNNSEESSMIEKADVENIKIISNTINVKSGSGENFKNIKKLNKGEIVNVTKELDEWYLVQLDNNEVGAVKKSDAKPVVVEEKEQNSDQKLNNDNQNITENENKEQSKKQDENKREDESKKPTNDTANSSNALISSENTMIDLINSERQKNSLPKLKLDLEVTKVARVKSQDMVDNDYFSHYSPNYGSPFEMMKSFGIKYVYAGENLAGNQAVESAHKALMNSSGHRKNILNPDFTHIGIGIKNSDKYGYMFTQMFISKPE